MRINYDAWKFKDYRSEETECPIHGTWYISEICPDCEADDLENKILRRVNGNDTNKN